MMNADNKKEKNAERKRKYRESQNPEQKNVRQITNKVSMQKRRLSMTPAKADIIRLQEKI